MSLGQIFKNSNNVKLTTNFKDFLRWNREKRHKIKDLSFVVPHAKEKKIAYLLNNRKDTTITWIGHSTFFIQISGLNIIIDPVWANHMGFVKRLVDPGIFPDQLPEIDVVLISHNHYDHLDVPSLKKLKGNPIFLVPLGLKGFFKSRGYINVEEFNLWSDKHINNAVFTFVPAQHWSKRALWDTNRSLWGGWIISENLPEAKCIYFMGDSGYFEGFKEIGNKFPIKYILAPIGAYEPEWFMHIQHVTPEEAVQSYIDSGAENFIPMHYDAFRLGDDTSREALDKLQAEWTRKQLDPSKLKILELGETIV